MKLIDYIKSHHATKAEFGRLHGMSKQQVGAMVKHGGYYVYDGVLMIAKRKLIIK